MFLKCSTWTNYFCASLVRLIYFVCMCLSVCVQFNFSNRNISFPRATHGMFPNFYNFVFVWLLFCLMFVCLFAECHQKCISLVYPLPGNKNEAKSVIRFVCPAYNYNFLWQKFFFFSLECFISTIQLKHWDRYKTSMFSCSNINYILT